MREASGYTFVLLGWSLVALAGGAILSRELERPRGGTRVSTLFGLGVALVVLGLHLTN